MGCLEAEIRKAISIMKKQLKTTSIIRKPNSNAANDFTILTGISGQIREQKNGPDQVGQIRAGPDRIGSLIPNFQHKIKQLIMQ